MYTYTYACTFTLCLYTCTDQGTHATSADHPKYAASNTTLNKKVEKEEVSDHPYTRYSDIHLSHGFVYDTIPTTASSSTSTSSKHSNTNDDDKVSNSDSNSSDDDNDDIRKSLESIKQSFRTLNTTSNYNTNNTNPFYISPTHTDHPNYSFFTHIPGSGPGSPTAHLPRHGLGFEEGHNSALYGDDEDDEGEEEDNSIESLTKGLQNYDYFINNPVITSGHNSDLNSTHNNSNRISYADKMRLRAAAERKMFDDVAGQGEIAGQGDGAGQGVRSEVRTDDDPTAEQTIYSY